MLFAYSVGLVDEKNVIPADVRLAKRPMPLLNPTQRMHGCVRVSKGE